MFEETSSPSRRLSRDHVRTALSILSRLTDTMVFTNISPALKRVEYSLLSLSTPLDNGNKHLNTTRPRQANSCIIFSAVEFQSPPCLMIKLPFHLSSSARPRNDHCSGFKFSTNCATRFALSQHSFSFCVLSSNMIVQRHKNDIVGCISCSSYVT